MTRSKGVGIKYGKIEVFAADAEFNEVYEKFKDILTNFGYPELEDADPGTKEAVQDMIDSYDDDDDDDDDDSANTDVPALTVSEIDQGERSAQSVQPWMKKQQ